MIKKVTVLVMLVFAIRGNVMASALPEFPFIGVRGEAEIDVKPDVVKLRFDVVAFSEKPGEALQQTQQRSSQLVALAEELGIPKENIESYGLVNETIRQSNRKNGYQPTEILGYEVSQSFSIKMTQLDKYSIFIDRLIALGNVTRVTPSFDVQNRDEIRRGLIAEASKDARQKAEALANAMGVRIKSVFAINQGTTFQSYFATFGLQEKVMSDQPRVLALASMDHLSSNMLVPRSITIKNEVNVVYKIK